MREAGDLSRIDEGIAHDQRDAPDVVDAVGYAILVPAVRQGSASEIVAMICVVLIMWRTSNVVIATGVGMAVLLFGAPWLDPLL